MLTLSLDYILMKDWKAKKIFMWRKKEANFWKQCSCESFPSSKKLNIVSFKIKNNDTIPKVNEKDESMKIFTDNSYDLESTTKMIAAADYYDFWGFRLYFSSVWK